MEVTDATDRAPHVDTADAIIDIIRKMRYKSTACGSLREYLLQYKLLIRIYNFECYLISISITGRFGPALWPR